MIVINIEWSYKESKIMYFKLISREDIIERGKGNLSNVI